MHAVLSTPSHYAQTVMFRVAPQMRPLAPVKKLNKRKPKKELEIKENCIKSLRNDFSFDDML